MIHFVTALPCEARPLIDHYRLKCSSRKTPFQIHESDDIRLIISGVGKANSATAVAYLQGITKTNEHIAWMNVGIAGHVNMEIGTSALAHKITDASTGQNWYPVFITKPNIPTASLLTVEQPEQEYREDALYDMEAASFFAAANRFAPSELIHCFKCISDNRASPAEHISKKIVTELIAAQLKMIFTLAEQFHAQTLTRPFDTAI